MKLLELLLLRSGLHKTKWLVTSSAGMLGNHTDCGLHKYHKLWSSQIYWPDPPLPSPVTINSSSVWYVSTCQTVTFSHDRGWSAFSFPLACLAKLRAVCPTSSSRPWRRCSLCSKSHLGHTGGWLKLHVGPVWVSVILTLLAGSSYFGVLCLFAVCHWVERWRCSSLFFCVSSFRLATLAANVFTGSIGTPADPGGYISQATRLGCHISALERYQEWFDSNR